MNSSNKNSSARFHKERGALMERHPEEDRGLVLLPLLLALLLLLGGARSAQAQGLGPLVFPPIPPAGDVADAKHGDKLRVSYPGNKDTGAPGGNDTVNDSWLVVCPPVPPGQPEGHLRGPKTATPWHWSIKGKWNPKLGSHGRYTREMQSSSPANAKGRLDRRSGYKNGTYHVYFAENVTDAPIPVRLTAQAMAKGAQTIPVHGWVLVLNRTHPECVERAEMLNCTDRGARNAGHQQDARVGRNGAGRAGQTRERGAVYHDWSRGHGAAQRYRDYQDPRQIHIDDPVRIDLPKADESDTAHDDAQVQPNVWIGPGPDQPEPAVVIPPIVAPTNVIPPILVSPDSTNGTDVGVIPSTGTSTTGVVIPPVGQPVTPIYVIPPGLVGFNAVNATSGAAVSAAATNQGGLIQTTGFGADSGGVKSGGGQTLVPAKQIKCGLNGSNCSDKTQKGAAFLAVGQ